MAVQTEAILHLLRDTGEQLLDKRCALLVVKRILCPAIHEISHFLLARALKGTETVSVSSTATVAANTVQCPGLKQHSKPELATTQLELDAVEQARVKAVDPEARRSRASEARRSRASEVKRIRASEAKRIRASTDIVCTR